MKHSNIKQRRHRARFPLHRWSMRRITRLGSYIVGTLVVAGLAAYVLILATTLAG